MPKVKHDGNRMVLLGLATIVVSVLITLFWYLGYAYDLLHKDGRRVSAEFTAVPQLQVGDPVKIDGRQEGEVKEIEDLGGGRGAKVTFDVAKDVGPLYKDAVVQLRWRTLLGSSFYLAVDRGTARSGDLGDAVIPRRQTRSQVELDDVTTVFQAGVRKGLTTMTDQLSKALRDPEPLPRLLDRTQAISPDATKALRALRGSDADVDLRRVITGTAKTVSALDAPDDDLRGLVAGAASFLGTTGDRAAELRTTLDRGPGLTDDVRTTLARLDRTLTGADRLVNKLDRAAPSVQPALAALRPALGDTTALLAKATPLVRQLRPTASALARTSRVGTPLLDALQPSLDRLDHTILPYLARKDPETQKPTSVMIGGTAAGFGGSAGQQDGQGHFIRFPASIGTSSVYLPCRTAITDPTAAQLLACDSLNTALSSYLQYVPKLNTSALRRGK